MSKAQDIIDNYNEQSEVIRGCLEANRKTIATMEAMESLFEHVSAKQSLSMEDIAALNLMGEFAVTGTSARPKDIGMSFESHTEPSIALEGILESMKSGLSSLAANSNVALKAIETRFFGTDVIIQAQQKRLDNINLAIKQLQVAGSKGSLRLSLKLPEGSSITDKSSYIAALQESVDCITDMTKTWVNELPKFTHSLIKTVTSFSSPGNYNDNLSRSFNDLNALFAKIGSGRGFSQSEGLKTQAYVSVPLVNNRVVIVNGTSLESNGYTERGEYRKALSHMGVTSVNAAHYYEVAEEKTVVYLHDITMSDLNQIKRSLETIIANLKLISNSGTEQVRDMRNLYRHCYTVIAAVNALTIGTFTYQQFAGLMELAAAIKMPAAIITALKTGRLIAAGAVVGMSAGINYLYYKLIKFIAGWVFTTMKVQYKLTETVDFMDAHLMSFNNSFFDFGFEVLEKASSPKTWAQSH